LSGGATADLVHQRVIAETKATRSLSDEELASYLMYPRVFTDFARVQAAYSNLSPLPTNVFFYGLPPNEEFTIDIGKGKTLVVSHLTTSEPDEDGQVTVYFELNGQPRPVRVPDRSRKPTREARHKADSQNPAHLAAPMPGLVVSVAVIAGQKVAKGDVILNLEAMKMQMAVVAERPGIIEKLHVKIGEQVDSKDLLADIIPLDK
ncbi:MAG: biotin/lipoyl-containing protein, partial [Aestuariivirga sp.]